MPAKAKASTLTQDAILATAAARRYGHVLPLPESADPASAKAAKLLKSMLAAALIEEWPTSSPKSGWRSEAGKHYLLRMTDAGRQLAGASADEPIIPNAEVVSAPKAPPEARPLRAPAGKLGRVLAAVQSGTGASLSELVALTNWQPHTIRASLTRLRQGGIPIELTNSDGQKRYCAGAASTAA